MRHLLTLAILFSSIAGISQSPPSAGSVLKEAYVQAAKEKKNVFVIFHASWCGWCHKMDTSMNDPKCRKFFDDNFVVRHLVVHESKGKEQLENPGALALLDKYHGNDQGIPFWLIFDSKGKLLADSRMRSAGSGFDASGDNCGCPASEKEVAYFIKVLKKTSSLSPDQEAIIQKRFSENNN